MSVNNARDKKCCTASHRRNSCLDVEAPDDACQARLWLVINKGVFDTHNSLPLPTLDSLVSVGWESLYACKTISLKICVVEFADRVR